MIKCHKCEKKAVVVENKIYYCGVCMLLKLRIEPILQEGARQRGDLEKTQNSF